MAIPRNTRRSGGPRTSEGRQLVSANSTKTGAYSMQVVLPGEDSGQFEDLKAQIFREFDPEGMVEIKMVHDLAVLSWKKLRVNRVDHGVMLQMMQLPLSEGSLSKSFGAGFRNDVMYRLEPYDPVTKDEFESTTELDGQLLALKNAPRDRCTSGAIQRKWPFAFAVLSQWASDYEVDIETLVAGQTPGPRLKDAIEELLDSGDRVKWLWAQGGPLQAAVQRVRDSRLLEFFKFNNTQRAHEDIDRAFYRSLAELRRQQDWRIRRKAILVEDSTTKLSEKVPGTTGSAHSTNQTNSQ